MIHHDLLKKDDLANLKSVVEKLYVNKLAPVSTDLCKLSDVVKYEVVKKDLYDQLVKRKYLTIVNILPLQNLMNKKIIKNFQKD